MLFSDQFQKEEFDLGQGYVLYLMYNLCITYAAHNVKIINLIIWLWGRAFGIGQHHDGITGTHTQAVQEDYVSQVSYVNFHLT